MSNNGYYAIGGSQYAAPVNQPNECQQPPPPQYNPVPAGQPAAYSQPYPQQQQQYDPQLQQQSYQQQQYGGGYQPPASYQQQPAYGALPPQQTAYGAPPQQMMAYAPQTPVYCPQPLPLSMPMSNKYSVQPVYCSCGDIEIRDTVCNRVAFVHIGGCCKGYPFDILDANNNMEVGKLKSIGWGCNDWDVLSRYNICVSGMESRFERRFQCGLGQKYLMDQSPFGPLVFDASVCAFNVSVRTAGGNGQEIARMRRHYSACAHDSMSVEILVHDAPPTHKMFLVMLTLAILWSAGGVIVPNCSNLPSCECNGCGALPCA